MFSRGKTKHADHMKQAAVELQLQARRDVSEEVAQCLGEREALHEELAHLAEQNQALVRENQTLRDSETLTRRKDQLIHPLMRDLSHKNKSNLGVRDTHTHTHTHTDRRRERERESKTQT